MYMCPVVKVWGYGIYKFIFNDHTKLNYIKIQRWYHDGVGRGRLQKTLTATSKDGGCLRNTIM